MALKRTRRNNKGGRRRLLASSKKRPNRTTPSRLIFKTPLASRRGRRGEGSMMDSFQRLQFSLYELIIASVTFLLVGFLLGWYFCSSAKADDILERELKTEELVREHPEPSAFVPEEPLDSSIRPPEKALSVVLTPEPSWGKGPGPDGGGVEIPVPELKPSSSPVLLAWQKNAVKAEADFRKPMIALVIDDLGMNAARTKEIYSMPYPLTLSFISYAPHLKEQTKKAKDSGHELLLHVPMEPLSKAYSPGPEALLVSMKETEIKERLDGILSSCDGYVGINNHMGSLFTADEKSMRAVLEVVRDKGLLFLDSVTSAQTKAGAIAEEMAVPTASRHVFIDHATDTRSVENRLKELEVLAGKYGYAIGIGHPHAKTIAALKNWLPKVQGEGVTLVPLSAIVQKLEEERSVLRRDSAIKTAYTP